MLLEEVMESARKRRPFESFWEADENGCHIWKGVLCGPSKNKAFRYGRITVNGKKILAHRYAWELKNGPIPAGLHALHKCDNPKCCNPDHIFLGTHKENMADMVRKGRSNKRPPAPKYGEENHRSKLSHAAVLAIISRRKFGETVTALAATFGVHHSHISRICNQKRRATQ